jgi:hypothetical protein
MSAGGSLDVAMRSRSRTVSRRRRTLPASETAIAAGWASSHGGERDGEEAPVLRLVADARLERLQDLLLAPGTEAREIA